MGTTITEKEAPIVDLGPMILRSHNELYDDNDGWNCVCFLRPTAPMEKEFRTLSYTNGAPLGLKLGGYLYRFIVQDMK